MKKLKLLILNYEYPPLGGGAGVISQFQANELAKLGHQITVVTCSDKASFYKDQPAENLEIIRLASRRSQDFKSGSFEKLDWMLKAKNYLLQTDTSGFDACIAHFSIPGGWVARKLKKATGLPYFVVSHGQDVPWFYPRQMFFYHLLTAYIIKRILHDAEKLWVQSDMMLQNATGFLKKAPQKVKKIPNGCDPDLYKPPPAKKPLQDGLELFFAGRLTRQKRPERLIETARILKNEGVVFNLIIAGDGSMKPKLEEITSRYGLTGNVHFTGWISKEKVREYYSQSHVLLAPSEAEGMSITILEALFCGLYVISTPVSGNPDLIEPGLNGELVKNKPGDFAKAVKNFLKQDSKMAKERKDQLEAFREKYSWYHIVKQYEKGISDVIG